MPAVDDITNYSLRDYMIASLKQEAEELGVMSTRLAAIGVPTCAKDAREAAARLLLLAEELKR